MRAGKPAFTDDAYNNDGLLTIADSAEYLKCSTKTIRRLIKARLIVASKVGGKYVFRREWLDAHVESGRVAGQPQRRQRKRLQIVPQRRSSALAEWVR